MYKKSQVTVFIIIVIVLVIVAGVLFYSNNKTRLAEVQQSDEVNLEEITPVRIYIEEVITRVVIDGLFLMNCFIIVVLPDPRCDFICVILFLVVSIFSRIEYGKYLEWIELE